MKGKLDYVKVKKKYDAVFPRHMCQCNYNCVVFEYSKFYKHLVKPEMCCKTHLKKINVNKARNTSNDRKHVTSCESR